MHANEAKLTILRETLNRITVISGKAWSAAAPFFQERSFSSGAHIIVAGDKVNEIHFLLSGMARFYYLDARGREFNKSFSFPGQALSSVSSLVTGQPSPFSIQALTSSSCLSLPYTALLQLSRQHQEWTSLRISMLEQLVIKREKREADFLLLSATERYLKFLYDYKHLATLIPNYHIASYLGITEVALSRIRKRLGLTPVNEKSAY